MAMSMQEETKKRLLREFARLYPDPRSELHFKNKYQLVISVVLSAQCTDKKVNEVTPLLFKAYPSFKALAAADRQTLEGILRPINYYKTKTKNLIALAAMVREQFHGRLPLEFDQLLALPGVGRKTANVVLGELGVVPSIPVDTHVFRVSQRLGIAKGKNTDAVEACLKENFHSDTWHHLHHWLIFHGRRVCKAQRPLCEQCTLHKLCPSVNRS